MNKRKTVTVFPYNLESHQCVCLENIQTILKIVQRTMPEGFDKKLTLGYLERLAANYGVLQAGLEAIEKPLENTFKSSTVTIIDYGR